MNTRIKPHSNLDRNNLADVCGLLRHDQFRENQIAWVSGLILSATTRPRGRLRPLTGRISDIQGEFRCPKDLSAGADCLWRNRESTCSERQDRVIVSHARVGREIVYFELSRGSGGTNLQAIDRNFFWRSCIARPGHFDLELHGFTYSCLRVT